MSIEVINDKQVRLIDQLLSIPFPFTDILRNQINASAITVKDLNDYFCIEFTPSKSEIPFPSWLPRVLLDWQLCVDGVPILGQLFQQNGFIQKYEIIDMGFTGIKWEYLLSSKPVPDTIYDLDEIIKILTATPVTILKAEERQNGIDVAMTKNGVYWVTCFRGCADCDLSSVKLPSTKQLSVSVSQPERQYSITSCDGCVSFQFSEVYLCHNHQM